MGTLILNQIKKQASFYLHEKYKVVKMVLTDVSEAELLAEEATNNVPWGPDAKTMTKIAEASFYLDDYWRIVDVLHKRFDNNDWKEWRQSYKSLVLLEFLLTHGPDDIADEFQCEIDVIQELATFQHIDEKGFNWGVHMQKRSENIQKLLEGGETLREARLKALRLTNEIQGFGSTSSPSSSSSSPSSSSEVSSFGSYSTSSTDVIGNLPSPTKQLATENYMKGDDTHSSQSRGHFGNLHVWDCPPPEENGSLLEYGNDESVKRESFFTGIFSKFTDISPLKTYDNAKTKPTYRSISDVGQSLKKKYDRQYSLGS